MTFTLKLSTTVTFVKSKVRWVLAGLVGALFLLFLILLAIGLHGFNSSIPQTVLLTGGTAVIMAALLLWDVSFSPRADMVLSYLLLLISPLISLLNVERLQRGAILHSMLALLINYLIFLAVYLLVYLFSNRIRAALLAGNLLAFALGIANFYVLHFRGKPLLPWDILAAQTAANVAGGLQFPITGRVIIACAVTGILCALAAQVRDPKPRWGKPRLIAAAANLCIVAVCCTAVGLTVSPSKAYFKIDQWDDAAGARRNGFLVNFALNLQTMTVAKPEGYSTNKVTSVVEKAMSSQPTTREPKPTIIAIMNEAFADLEYVGDMQLSEDVMPFLHGLRENTIRGRLVMPVFGGGTCNSEYEFLTGNVCQMLRPGTYPMQQFVTKPSPSLASTLKSQGYRTVGIHPYYGNGWNRNRAYPFLGFDEFLDITAFENPEMVRTYISDRSSYQKVIERYEARGNDPLFIFNVTMQNHVTYSKAYPELTEDSVLPEGDAYPEANLYLSLIRESDRALEELITYFEGQDQPVIVVFFGDHQPALGDGYVDLLAERSGLDAQEKAYRTHQVPFFIWANYDIEEQDGVLTSSNFLSTRLLQTAGLDMPAYNHYLAGLSSQLPVLSPFGIVNSSGDWFDFYDEENPYAELVNEYQMVQYNQVFDKNRLDDLFYLEDS